MRRRIRYRTWLIAVGIIVALLTVLTLTRDENTSSDDFGQPPSMSVKLKSVVMQTKLM